MSLFSTLQWSEAWTMDAQMTHNDGSGALSTRRGRSGSEKRQRDALLQLRMAKGDREALGAHARRLGFKNAQDLVWSRLEADLAEARQVAS
ncbi:hypothetical protein [Mycobacterium marinum]